MGLGKEPVMAIAVVTENLWCSCGNKLVVVDHDDETIKVAILFFSYRGSYREINFICSIFLFLNIYMLFRSF